MFSGSKSAWDYLIKKIKKSLFYLRVQNKTLTFAPAFEKEQHGGLAQLARAPALHAGGQRFESVILHVMN